MWIPRSTVLYFKPRPITITQTQAEIDWHSLRRRAPVSLSFQRRKMLNPSKFVFSTVTQPQPYQGFNEQVSKDAYLLLRANAALSYTVIDPAMHDRRDAIGSALLFVAQLILSEDTFLGDYEKNLRLKSFVSFFEDSKLRCLLCRNSYR